MPVNVPLDGDTLMAFTAPDVESLKPAPREYPGLALEPAEPFQKTLVLETAAGFGNSIYKAD